MSRIRFDVQVRRGDRFWLVDVPAIGHVTQARHLREVDTMARDLISLTLDVEPESMDLDVVIEQPPAVAAHLRRAAELRDQEAQARHEAAAELRAAARELRDAGLPLRDVGEVLGVSYQRAHQLVDA